MTAPAAKANTTITISGSNGNYTVSPDPIVLANGLQEQVTITNNSDITVRLFGSSRDPRTLAVSYDNGATWFACFSNAVCLINPGQSLPADLERRPPENPTLRIATNENTSRLIADVPITGDNGSGGNSSPTSATTTGPSALLQQVGLPLSGSCNDVDDHDLAWGTGLTGGWGPSWAQWPHGGRGGEVCSRMLEWSSGNGWRLTQ